MILWHKYDTSDVFYVKDGGLPMIAKIKRSEVLPILEGPVSVLLYSNCKHQS